jgi:predicted transcriptional regulator
MQKSQKTVVEMSAEIVAAQASNKTMSAEDITESLRRVFDVLQEIQLGNGVISEDAASSDSLAYLRRNPLASIQRNQVVCLESGKPYKLLSNRHLALYGLTPREYKKKWGIPMTMPLSARSLTNRRRKLAKELGMGKQLAEWRAERKRFVG